MTNPRLNQLMIQAGGNWTHGYVEDPETGDLVFTNQARVDTSEMDGEFFAKLLLADVMSICKEQKWQCGFQSYRDGINDVMHKIMFKFGVPRS